MKSIFCTLLKRKDGAVAIEFALVLLTILLPITFGVIEFGRAYVYAQKISATSHSLADFASQSNGTITKADMQTFGGAAAEIMKPFTFNGTVIFTGVNYIANNTPVIAWQGRYGAGGSSSHLGAAGGAANMPPGFSGTAGSFYVVTEVFQQYTPLLDVTGNIIPALQPSTYYRVAFFRPRFSATISCTDC